MLELLFYWGDRATAAILCSEEMADAHFTLLLRLLMCSQRNIPLSLPLHQFRLLCVSHSVSFALFISLRIHALYSLERGLSHCILFQWNTE